MVIDDGGALKGSTILKTVALIPSAQRLLDSLRSIGHDLPSAVADLVDNSIAAKATEVDIHMTFDGKRSWIRVSDNGIGMSSNEINEALRLGTQRDYEPHDLGRFGLGLKLASFSQARRLTVATRKSGSDAIHVRAWDLDLLKERDVWEVLILDQAQCPKHIIDPLIKRQGTVVLWERLDRILAYRDPDGRPARQWFAGLCREVETHLGMVFHRFLRPVRHTHHQLTIRINGERVLPWDPYCLDEATEVLGSRVIRFEHGGAEHVVRIQPYVLPAESEFSSARARDIAGGPKRWNRQQGFYVYRNDRMIQSGGWNRLRTSDEHTKLARISLDFEPSADSAFKVDVAKMRVQFPHQIREDLRRVASEAAARAQMRYRGNRVQRQGGHGYRTHQSIAGSTNRPEKFLGQSRDSGELVATEVPVRKSLSTPTAQTRGGEVTLLERIVSVLIENLSDDLPTLRKVLRILAAVDPALTRIIREWEGAGL